MNSTSRHSSLLRAASLALFITALLTACPGKKPQIKEEPLPDISIAPEPIPVGARVRVDPKLLPKSGRASWPAFDGDSFFVSIPAQLSGGQSSADVFGGVVAPVLRAVGFERKLEELSGAQGSGTRLPPADLARLATVVCYEVDDRRFERYQPVCNTMRRGEPNSIAERVFLNGDGMTSAQFKADLERPRLEYFFRQMSDNVPIEHMGVLAGRWDGEAVTVVQGTVLNRFSLTNARKLEPAAAIDIALKQLAGMKGVGGVDRERKQHAELVLLPYGAAQLADGSNVAGLRYAYRTLLFGTVPLPGTRQVIHGSWLAWIDAQSGKLLQLVPQFDEVSATGMSWRRDPSTPTQLRFTEVDPSSGGQYILEFKDAAPGRFTRIDRLGNAVFTDGEVSIADNTGGSSPTFAQFNQAPISDAANAVCATGGNNTFRQVNALAHLDNYRQLIMAAGSFPVFPEAQLTVWMDAPGSSTNFAVYDAFGTGQSQLRFTEGPGFVHANCPDEPNTKMNGAQDATTMTHEFAHISTKRLQNRRPADWCGMAPCPMPAGGAMFHDFADAWANGYASTPCMSGYSNKNQGGGNASLNCIANHVEDGNLPRLAAVTVPFDPLNPQDHFPEHRNFQEGPYPDGQIAAAALWMVRQGMRSKCLPSGTAQFWVRLNRALWNFGFLTTTCTGCDRDIYRFLQDLQKKMAEQWATAGQPGGPPAFHHNGAHTTNKVMSGFAKTGVFLVPYQCLDGDAATEDAGFCPAASGGENGGDAIVDVDDNETADDVNIDGIVHREVDYSRRAGGPPTFHAWTGPRIKFNAVGNARAFTPSVATPSICNTKFQVEVANDDAFTSNLTVSGWINVPTTAAPECYGTWTPATAEWDTLKGAAGDVKLYYRVRTRDAADANEKISTSPGNGLFTVPPAYVIANDAGTP